MAAQPLFLPLPGGTRFALHHAAQGPRRGAVLYVPPFGEEMNKSRRMAAVQARRLAGAGFEVLQPDLLGCGDSPGDFGDATWAAWVQDVCDAAAWLRAQAPGPLWLWGLRAGGLLACEAAPRIGGERHLLLWQPVPSGKLVVQQFLRLKVAADMLAGQAKGALDAVRETLAAGGAVEIAGYTVTAALLSGLEQATLAPVPEVAALHWLELGSTAGAAPAPASERALVAWREAGVPVHAQVVAGPAFWQTVEIEAAPALWQATTALFEAVAA